MSGAPVPSVDELKSSLERTRIYRALKIADPATFERIVRAYHDAILQGRSMEELRTVSLPLLLPVYSRSLPNASDEAILDFGRWLVAALAELQKAPPRTCVRYLMSSSDDAAREESLQYLSKGTKDRELDVMAHVIESAAPGRRRASAKQQEAYLERILDRAHRLVGDDIAALADPNRDPAKGCRAVFGFYSGVMSLPKKDAALMLRAVSAQQ